MCSSDLIRADGEHMEHLGQRQHGEDHRWRVRQAVMQGPGLGRQRHAADQQADQQDVLPHAATEDAFVRRMRGTLHDVALGRFGGECQSRQSVRNQVDPQDVDGQQGHMRGGNTTIAGSISSQFLSSLLMCAPACEAPVHIHVTGELVSQPYVHMTLQMIRDFGGRIDAPDDLSHFQTYPGPYSARVYDIEPDASAASYFFAAAAVTAGQVTVRGLHAGSLQGDVQFATALQQMGCTVEWQADRVTVTGAPLRGIEIDMNAISDTAQTLAAVAVFASGPTTIRNVAHMRHKETDRITAVVTELQRAGIHAVEHADGLTIHSGQPKPCDIHTYDDHRMAMSFSLLGLRTPGIRILDPACTAKTYPNFFHDLESLCGKDHQ